MTAIGSDIGNVQYQGRQARRSGSEQRRVAILEAVLRIVVRDGIRNVRHRAVAKEADVPLSATTYYFKDIEDLICDAFTLFAQQALEQVIEPFQRQVFALLDGFDGGLPEDAEEREKVLSTLAGMVTAYLIAEVTQQREHLLAEQAFTQEAVLDSRLETLAAQYFAAQREVMLEACRKLGSSQPELDAEFGWSVLVMLERQLLLQGTPTTDYVQPRVLHLIKKIAR